MRSIWQILNSVIDGEINTPEEASAMIEEEADEYARVLQIDKAHARAQLLANINNCTALCLTKDAEKLKELFQ